MLIKIDKGVPIPPPTHSGYHRETPERQALYKLEVGDSFFTPRRDAALEKMIKNHHHRTKRKFSVRAIVENGVKGTRIWRTG